MLDLGAKTSKVDPFVFYWLDNENNTKGILACHVDDSISDGTKFFEDEFVTSIRKCFSNGQEDIRASQYLAIVMLPLEI